MNMETQLPPHHYVVSCVRLNFLNMNKLHYSVKMRPFNCMVFYNVKLNIMNILKPCHQEVIGNIILGEAYHNLFY